MCARGLLLSAVTVRYTRADQQAAVAVEPLWLTCASSGADSAAAAAAAAAAVAVSSASFLASTSLSDARAAASTSFLDLLAESLKKKIITTVLTAVKKNKQLAHTPGGPGRLRSWSGPVETDFQGRLRFSYANRPGARARARASLRARARVRARARAVAQG